MSNWRRRWCALLPASIAARGALLIALAACSIGAPGIILHRRLLEDERRRDTYSSETFLAVALATCFANAPTPAEGTTNLPARVAKLSSRVSWAGVFDATGDGIELRGKTALAQREILAQIDLTARTPQSKPLVMNGAPSRRFELLTLPQPADSVTLAAIVDRGAPPAGAGVTPWVWPVGLMLAGLSCTLAWLQYGIERPIRGLSRRLTSVPEGLAEVGLDAAMPRELGAVAQSLAETHNELQRWRVEATLWRHTVEERVDARTRQATQAQRRAEREADTDALTQLANRRAFERDGPALFDAGLQQGGELALIMLDVDGLKRFNDVLGHPAGDKLLMFVGELLRATVRRGSDRAVRFGGDEFALILPGTTATQAAGVAQRLTALFAQWARTLTGVEPPPGLSAGVAALRENRLRSWADLVQAADEALYWARRQGRRVASTQEARAGGARTEQRETGENRGD